MSADQSTNPSAAIFVVVYVSYSYYRYHENVGAAVDFESAKAIAQRESVEKGSRGHALPIVESYTESAALDSLETGHIWIEVFSQNTEGLSSTGGSEILAAKYKELAEWIMEAAPVLESACCIALDAHPDNVFKMPGCQALLETCPIEFFGMPHLISQNALGQTAETE